MTKQEFLSASLPHGLMFINLNDNTIEQLSGIDTFLVANWKIPPYPNGTICVYSSIDYSSMWSIDEIKLILRPLSDLTKEIEHNGENIHVLTFLCEKYRYLDPHRLLAAIQFGSVDFNIMMDLISLHFDVAGLIEKGEAIDVNTLQENPYK